MVEEFELDCPFCNKGKIKVLHLPFISRTSMGKCRAGRGGKVFSKERYEILAGCSNCGKPKKEIEKVFKGKRKLSHKERLKLWKKKRIAAGFGEINILLLFFLLC